MSTIFASLESVSTFLFAKEIG